MSLLFYFILHWFYFCPFALTFFRESINMYILFHHFTLKWPDMLKLTPLRCMFNQNPFLVKFFSRTINMYLQFLSFRLTDMTPVVEILCTSNNIYLVTLGQLSPRTVRVNWLICFANAGQGCFTSLSQFQPLNNTGCVHINTVVTNHSIAQQSLNCDYNSLIYYILYFSNNILKMNTSN